MALTLSLLLPAIAAGQRDEADEVAVVAAVLEHVRETLPPGPIALDPRVFGARGKGRARARHPSGRMETVRRRVPNGIIKSVEEVIRCEPVATVLKVRCRFVGASAALAFGEMKISGIPRR